MRPVARVPTFVTIVGIRVPGLAPIASDAVTVPHQKTVTVHRAHSVGADGRAARPTEIQLRRVDGVTRRVTCAAVVQVGPHVRLTSVARVAVAVRVAWGARRGRRLAERSASGSVAGAARGACGVAGAAIGRVADCVGLAPVERIGVAVRPPGVAVSVCAEEFLRVALGGIAKRVPMGPIACHATVTTIAVHLNRGLASVEGVAVAMFKSSMASESTRAIRAGGNAVRRRCAYSATRPAVRAVVLDVDLASVALLKVAIFEPRTASEPANSTTTCRISILRRGGTDGPTRSAVSRVRIHIGLATVGGLAIAVTPFTVVAVDTTRAILTFRKAVRSPRALGATAPAVVHVREQPCLTRPSSLAGREPSRALCGRFGIYCRSTYNNLG